MKYFGINPPVVEDANALFNLMKQVNSSDPSQDNIVALEEWIDSHPDLFDDLWSLSRYLQAALIHKILRKKVFQVCQQKELELLSRNLGADGASPLEQLLIDNVIITLLRLQWVESVLIDNMDNPHISPDIQLFLERRLSAAQRRHLRACDTLARVRKLASNSPQLQVNIATEHGQQVNIAGDFTKEEKTGEKD